jgi:cytochrome b6-f complex iron-sulfur subunit
MKRRDFLNANGKALGVGIIARILEGCSPGSAIPTPTAGFTVDLSSPANTGLKTVGGFILDNGIYIICTAPSTYVALSSICTHQGCTVNYGASSKQFSCPCHGGLFNISGKVLSGPPPSPLKQYTATLSGNTLTIS